MFLFTPRFYRRSTLSSEHTLPLRFLRVGLLLLFIGQVGATGTQAQLLVTGTTPPANAVAASRTTNVAATFNQPLGNTPAVQQAVKVFGQQTGGRKAGTVTVSGNTLTFDPTTDFKAGEQVLATFTTAVQGSTGGSLSKPQVFQFTAATAPSTGVFTGGASLDADARNGFIGDLNGDGSPDLIDYTYGPFAEGTIRLSNGDGTYGSPQSLSLSYFTRSLALGDVDEDGDLDLISAHNVRYSPNGLVSVHLNNGQGSFSGGSSLTVGSFPTSATLSDVNGDGHLDLLFISTIGSNALSIRFGNGNGTFRETGQDIPADETPIVPVDIDNDGDLDLFTGNQAYLNNGTGFFAGSQAINADAASAFGDLDGDGDLDLVTSGGTILRNNGAGTFTASGAGTLAGNNRLGDVDGDGDLDLVSGSGTTVRVRLNDGTSLFSGSQQVAVAGTGLLSLADVDEDGDLDILASNGYTVSLRLNGAANFAITGLSPARNAIAAPRTTDVAATFNQTLANTAATQGALKVYSAQAGGRKAGTATVSGNTLAFNPTTDFKPGETVFTTVTSAAQSSSGASLATGQVFQFRTATTPSSGTFAEGSNPTVDNGTPSLGAVTFGDVDGDGDLDLLTANTSNIFNMGSVGVRLNDGKGIFGPGQIVPIDRGTGTLATGDIDGDGDLDFVATNYTFTSFTGRIGALNVRVNNGNGSFSNTQQLSITDDGYESIRFGDVDSDGDLDLVGANFTGRVDVFLNDGGGTFSFGPRVAVGQFPKQVELTDVDGDGDLDVLTFTRNSISVRRNDGQGSFSGTQEVAVADYPRGFAVGDVNGDGSPDLLVSRYGLDSNEIGQVDVFANDGSGGFTLGQSVAVGASPQALKLGDVDGDGDLDFLVCNYYTGVSNNTVTVRLNNGNGVFSGNQQVPVTDYPGSLDLGDVDGDGDLDLATASSLLPQLIIRLNQNTAQGPLAVVSVAPARNTVAAPRATDVAVTFNQTLGNTATTQNALKVHSAQAGGLKAGGASVSGMTLTFNPNADFKPGETVFASVLASAQSSGGQSLAKGQVFQFTAATATAAATFSGTEVATGAGANTTALGDLDRDGDLDLLTANTNASSVWVRLNNGNGTFAGTQEVRVDDGPYAIALGDIDGDGDLDFVTANASRRTVSVRFNDGRGSFPGALEVPVGVSPHAVALGDIDADGDLDLLAANYTDGTDNNLNSTVSVRLNNGFGGFSGSQEVSIGTRPLSIALGDVDNDDDLDFATANSNTNKVSVRLNDGAGTFSGTQEVSVGYQPHGVALADVDKDGNLDILAAHLVDSGVSVRLNNGTGTFTGTQEVAVNGARSLATGDVNGDGNLDLLVGNVWGNTVAVRLNSGTGTFTGSQAVAVGTAVSAVSVGDLDGNGTLDFVTANANANTASVRLNAAAATAAPANQALAYSARRPQELSVYPNPAHDRVQLQLPLDLAAQSVQVSVRNSLGQVVLEKTLAPQAEAELSLANLPTGVYHVQVRSKQGLLSQRLVVE
ncbi:FG-GAP-like repeat-containing protein [Hymenobacter sp. GOD-10R]|uniref:FG-GAP-like repeat-containing protein n=1 Tax=Hymenobacter sp. GOD-10R TaxID=3093922 RepID=UPI002D766A17|nr:FG-GAP-like repeat-containing protein [Hymenobacter sp. GOD-10R]WRQ27716.1 FG-GAP-like repeat-containing protein [Hymenobacter sp. GOD-10R]